MLFANTTFGQSPEKTIKISNHSVQTVYCAYVYGVDERVAAYTGESIGYHVKGWVAVQSGHAEYIPYTSYYKPFVYFILENNIETSEMDEKKFAPSAHPVPVQLLNAIAGGKKPRVDQFEIVQGWDGSIKPGTGADHSDLKHVTFYSRKEVTIDGPVLKLVEPQTQGTKDEFDGVYSTLGVSRTGKDYALLFATNEYPLWEKKDERFRLTTPINDARALHDVLEQEYGFEAEVYEDRTIEQMTLVLHDYIDKSYEDGDQLLIYFTGHGVFEKDIKDGFIAAKDSAAPLSSDDLAPGDERTYLRYADLERTLDRLDCKRILLILDVCYGGTFDEKIALNENPLTKGGGPSIKGIQQTLKLADTLKVKTRWYLSAGEKEEVLAETVTGEHSPFASSLVSILKGPDGILDDDVLTIPEIERHLPSLVDAEVDKKMKAYKQETGWTGEWQNQTPASGPFGSAKAADKAFVFIKRRVTSVQE